jgi:hypothetical protein
MEAEIKQADRSAIGWEVRQTKAVEKKKYVW